MTDEKCYEKFVKGYAKVDVYSVAARIAADLGEKIEKDLEELYKCTEYSTPKADNYRP